MMLLIRVSIIFFRKLSTLDRNNNNRKKIELCELIRLTSMGLTPNTITQNSTPKTASLSTTIMFFFFFGGINNNRIRRIVERNVAPCPNCTTSSLNLVELCTSLHVFFWPVWSWDCRQALHCVNCGLVTSLTSYEQTKQEIEATRQTNSRSLACPSCGRPVSSVNWSFCPDCGGSI